MTARPGCPPRWTKAYGPPPELRPKPKTYAETDTFEVKGYSMGPKTRPTKTPCDPFRGPHPDREYKDGEDYYGPSEGTRGWTMYVCQWNPCTQCNTTWLVHHSARWVYPKEIECPICGGPIQLDHFPVGGA